MKVAIVGATGLVGSVMLKVLEEKKFPVSELIPVASEKSKGKKVEFCKTQYEIKTLEEALKEKPHLALFSAGTEVSRRWAPLFAQEGTYVIDNSSCWRMEKHIKLVVPEVNKHVIEENDKIIANPNCSTIQLVVVLNPLHVTYKVKRVVISTYQSVTGTGAKAVKQLFDERNGKEGEKAYPHRIDLNCFPFAGTFLENGYTTEEMKLVNETRKIMNCHEIKITSTVVRIPVIGGHSESVNIEFEKEFKIEDIRKILSSSPGIIVLDEPNKNIYPMPILAENRNEVFVGRIRKDESIDKGLNLWIVADNLRKGAATNAVQIAEYLIEKGFLKK